MGLLSRRERNHVDDLVEAYRAEAEHAAHLRQHAERARYPQVAERLRTLAATEEAHAGLLRERITGIGGGVPPVAPAPVEGHNQWARAAAALAAAQRKRRRLIDQIAHWDPEEPDTVAVLRRIEAEDTRALASYEDVVMRSDPHAID